MMNTDQISFRLPNMGLNPNGVFNIPIYSIHEWIKSGKGLLCGASLPPLDILPNYYKENIICTEPELSGQCILFNPEDEKKYKVIQTAVCFEIDLYGADITVSQEDLFWMSRDIHQKWAHLPQIWMLYVHMSAPRVYVWSKMLPIENKTPKMNEKMGFLIHQLSDCLPAHYKFFYHLADEPVAVFHDQRAILNANPELL